MKGVTVSLDDNDIARIKEELHDLQAEHRDLDQVIAHLLVSPPDDDLLIRRLKKRKLSVKDRIGSLESLLTPDILA